MKYQLFFSAPKMIQPLTSHTLKLSLMHTHSDKKDWSTLMVCIMRAGIKSIWIILPNISKKGLPNAIKKERMPDIKG